MRIGKKEFDTKNHCYVMGILNVTPDSFSDGGRWNSYDTAMQHVEQMIKDGMDIVDIGGESTRPGYTEVSVEEEIERVAPMVRAIRKTFDIPISVDTYKSAVAKASLSEGAHMINDIWGFLRDDNMASVVKEYDAACVLMHNRENMMYTDFIPDVVRDLGKCIKACRSAGIEEEKIILDPGVGFAKTYEQNLSVLKHLKDFRVLGYPLLLGTSRKSVIGLSLDLPKGEREEGTLATTVLAVEAEYGFVRVHDVKKNKRAILMAEAIKGAE